MPRSGGGAAGAPQSTAVASTMAATGGGSGRVSRLRDLAAGVPAAFEEALMSGAGGGGGGAGGVVATAAVMFRAFEAESAMAREGTAGGLADAGNLPRGLGEEGGYKQAQEAFVSR